MSNEIRTAWVSGHTLYALVFRKADLKVWHPSAEEWEAYGTGSRTANDYNAITLSEEGNSGYFAGDFPTAITADTVCDIQIRRQIGVSPADSDTLVGIVEIDWSGTAVVTAEVVSLTATSVCNLGLSFLGGAEEAEVIDSINDGTDVANLCQRIFPIARKYVLALLQPEVATTYVGLGAEVSFDEKGEWEYAFNLPSDCLKPLAQVDEDDHSNNQYKYEILRDKLLTNSLTNTDQDSAYIKYINDEENMGNLGFHIIQAIAVYFAFLTAATKLKGQAGFDRQADLLQLFHRIIGPDAKGIENRKQFTLIYNLEHPNSDDYSCLGGRN